MAYEKVKVKQPLLLRILPFVGLGGFFLGWQALLSFGVVPETLLASPVQVA